jgi:glycosyltransferase involved in cell wall biosynthesis
MKRKLLLVSDSISCTSGLGRITRDLALRIYEHLSDIVDVATAGYGGSGSKRFPFSEYHFHDVSNWLLPELPQIARDFAGDEELIVMWIWDLSRLYWVADPRLCPMNHLRHWLDTAKIKKWVYHPIDAEGPNGKLSTRLAQTMKAFDRVLDYSAFSCGVTGNTEHLPHGIDTSVFKPHDRKEARKQFREAGFPQLKEDSFLIGIVATNQARKDWALGIQTARILLDRGLDVKLWCHIDVLERFWSLPNLIADFGLQDRVAITISSFTDEQMARFYSACDVTLGIGLGEGAGYPLFESTSCGAPVVHGNYGGGPEYLTSDSLVEPVAWRFEGIYSCKRPVFNPMDWADRAQALTGTVPVVPEHIKWENAWSSWESWFRKGLE